MSSPLISVIIPAYNAEETLERCLWSVRQQDYPEFEVILVDDGSADKTGEICDRAAAEDPKIRVIHQENLGVSGARNTGLREAAGEWILFLDADDALAPGALLALSAYPEQADACCGRIVRGKLPGEERAAHPAPAFRTAGEGIEEVLADPTEYGTLHGWAFRREICRGESFDTTLRMGEDSEWVLRVLKHCRRLVFLPETVYMYTVSASSTVHGWKPGQTEVWLETVEKIGRTEMRGAENWPLFILAHLLLILTHDVFHPANPAGETEKRKAAKDLLKLPVFVEAFQRADLRRTDRKRRLVLQWLKRGWILPAEGAIRIRQQQNRHLAEGTAAEGKKYGRN